MCQCLSVAAVWLSCTAPGCGEVGLCVRLAQNQREIVRCLGELWVDSFFFFHSVFSTVSATAVSVGPSTVPAACICWPSQLAPGASPRARSTLAPMTPPPVFPGAGVESAAPAFAKAPRARPLSQPFHPRTTLSASSSHRGRWTPSSPICISTQISRTQTCPRSTSAQVLLPGSTSPLRSAAPTNPSNCKMRRQCPVATR